LCTPPRISPRIAKDHGAVLVEVNVEESAITPTADFFLRGRSGEVLPRLVEEVKRSLGTPPKLTP
jgi:NAD-dependent deacetylase